MSALATNTVTNVESEDAPALWRSLGSSVGSGRPRSASCNRWTVCTTGKCSLSLRKCAMTWCLRHEAI
jgi:hypothetical protein